MKIHHLSCGTSCPFVGGKLPGIPKKLVTHVLLIETNDGLVLVDTGFGRDDLAHPHRRFGFVTSAFLGVSPQTDVSAFEQINALGFSAKDVRHIIPTHLDFDHIGGISDFPDAQIHVFAAELDRALQRKHLKDRLRYYPHTYKHQPRWFRHQEAKGEPWFGFASVRSLPGLPPEVLMIPLHGHSAGHTGIAVQTSEGWLLHAGDAYYDRSEILDGSPRWMRLLVSGIHHDPKLTFQNQRRLGELLSRRSDVRVFSAHDPLEFASFHPASTVMLRGASPPKPPTRGLQAP